MHGVEHLELVVQCPVGVDGEEEILDRLRLRTFEHLDADLLGECVELLLDRIDLPLRPGRSLQDDRPPFLVGAVDFWRGHDPTQVVQREVGRDVPLQ